MINTTKVQVWQEKIESISCDKCCKIVRPDDMIEYPEMHHIRLTGGYGSIFGDETKVDCDLCQHCLKEMLGPYCRITEGG